MERKKVVLEVYEKDYNLIKLNANKIPDLVRVALLTLGMDEESITKIPDVLFLKVIKKVNTEYEMEEFGIPKKKKANLRLVRKELEKELDRTS